MGIQLVRDCGNQPTFLAGESMTQTSIMASDEWWKGPIHTDILSIDHWWSCLWLAYHAMVKTNHRWSNNDESMMIIRFATFCYLVNMDNLTTFVMFHHGQWSISWLEIPIIPQLFTFDSILTEILYWFAIMIPINYADWTFSIICKCKSRDLNWLF